MGKWGMTRYTIIIQLQEYAYLSNYATGEYPINGAVVSTLYERVLANPILLGKSE
jgi:hypothetical protein